MKYYFTGDLHLNHFNIISYTNRPFKTLEEMNETIIRRYNERVKPEDFCFHIGDFCFKNSKGGKEGEGLPIKANELIPKFNGRIVFLCGNHDRNNSLKTPIISCHIRYANKIINLVHNPEFVDMNVEINLVGHVHNKWDFRRIRRGEKFTDAINVGVDVNNFYPQTFEELISKYHRWKKKEGYK